MTGDLEERLRGFGLSGHQARVYLKTLELGPLTGAQLAEKAHVPRSKVYDVCKSLIDKGLVEPESGAPRRFRAMPLARFLEQRKSQLHREAEELEQQHRELESLLSQVMPIPGIPEGGLAVLEGDTRIATHLRLMVRDATARIDVMLADGSLPSLGTVMEEKSPAVKVRVVYAVVKEELPKVRRFVERGVAFRHARASVFTSALTFDGKQALVMIHPKVGDAPSAGLWSSEPPLVASEEARFELVWKDALPLARRQKDLLLGRAPATTELLRQEGDRSEGFAAFAAACIAALGSEDVPVDLALGAPFLAVVQDPRMRSLLAKHRARLLLPFPRDPKARAVAEAAAALGEARQVPPWLGEQAMLVVDHTTLVASIDPRTGQLETIISSGEEGLVRWFRRVYELAWQTAEELRPPGREGRSALWNFSHRTAEAEAWLRHLVSIATSVVEVRGPPAAEAYIASLVGDGKVQVRRLPLPKAAEGSLIVGVDGRLLLVLEGVRFSSRGTSRMLQAVDACVLTDSRALLAFQRGLPADGRRQR